MLSEYHTSGLDVLLYGKRTRGVKKGHAMRGDSAWRETTRCEDPPSKGSRRMTSHVVSTQREVSTSHMNSARREVDTTQVASTRCGVSTSSLVSSRREGSKLSQ